MSYNDHRFLVLCLSFFFPNYIPTEGKFQPIKEKNVSSPCGLIDIEQIKTTYYISVTTSIQASFVILGASCMSFKVHRS